MASTVRPDKPSLIHSILTHETANHPWSLEQAYQHCERIARSHYENFPVGSLLIPRRLRKHFYSIYTFARIADDIADERYGGSITPAERLRALGTWRELLAESLQGQARHPVFIALSETIRSFDLPVSLFEDLISAFSQDVETNRYSTFAELLDYCRRSANPIGRLVLLLFGKRDEQLHSWSDSICTALQLTNHWQDLTVDLAKDRIYVPTEDLSRFGVTIEELRAGEVSGRFRQLMAFEIERTREMFEQGKPLCSAVQGRLGLELRVIRLAGMRILDRIEQNGYDLVFRRPVITRYDKLRIFGSALLNRTF